MASSMNSLGGGLRPPATSLITVQRHHNLGALGQHHILASAHPKHCPGR